jgi:hypothetical protein
MSEQIKIPTEKLQNAVGSGSRADSSGHPGWSQLLSSESSCSLKVVLLHVCSSCPSSWICSLGLSSRVEVFSLGVKVWLFSLVSNCFDVTGAIVKGRYMGETLPLFNLNCICEVPQKCWTRKVGTGYKVAICYNTWVCCVQHWYGKAGPRVPDVCVSLGSTSSAAPRRIRTVLFFKQV